MICAKKSWMRMRTRKVRCVVEAETVAEGMGKFPGGEGVVLEHGESAEFHGAVLPDRPEVGPAAVPIGAAGVGNYDRNVIELRRIDAIAF